MNPDSEPTLQCPRKRAFFWVRPRVSASITCYSNDLALSQYDLLVRIPRSRSGGANASLRACAQ